MVPARAGVQDRFERPNTTEKLGGIRDQRTRPVSKINNLAKSATERDVVCGMQIDPPKAAGKSEYKGKTYYFCSKRCKAKFDANPQHYAK